MILSYLPGDGAELSDDDSPRIPPGDRARVIGVLPGLGNYSGTSSEEGSSDSDSDVDTTTFTQHAHIHHLEHGGC